jgi:hypothetical protein
MKKDVAALPAPVKKPTAGAPAPGGSVPMPGKTPEGWRQYQGKGYVLNYPDNWQVSGGGDDVTLAPRDGVVQQQVGFGALIGMFAPQRGREGLQAATDDLIKKLKGENPKMVGSGAGKSVTVDGASGLMTKLSEESPFGGGETDGLVTVSRPAGLVYFVFVAPDRDYTRVEKTFQQMLDSLRWQ